LAGLVGAAVAAALAAAAPVAARAPGDIFVMAKQIDDIITLDPAEVFEFSGAEYAANVYERLVYFDLDDVRRIEGGAADSWTVSEDGRTYTFRLRPGQTFHSGNPVTARDAAYSLQRVVRLNKSPAFILTQFGFTPENVGERIRAVAGPMRRRSSSLVSRPASARWSTPSWWSPMPRTATWGTNGCAPARRARAPSCCGSGSPTSSSSWTGSTTTGAAGRP
jgi:hypothetical protein